VVSLILQRGKGRSSGLAMEMKTAQVATLRDGKVTRIDNYENRAEALEAAGLRVWLSGAHDGSTPMFSVPV
jgi:ketosteroid isomerase-like protein